MKIETRAKSLLFNYTSAGMLSNWERSLGTKTRLAAGISKIVDLGLSPFMPRGNTLENFRIELLFPELSKTGQLLQTTPTKPTTKKTLKLLSAEQENSIRQSFDQYKTRKLELLYNGNRVDPPAILVSTQDAFKIISSPLSQPNTMVRFRCEQITKVLSIYKNILLRLDCEVVLARVRGTNEWMIIKGSRMRGPYISEINGLYLFDLYIHTHPDQLIPLPQGIDILTDHSNNIDGTTRQAIIGYSGLTFYQTTNLRRLDKELDPISIHQINALGKEIIEKLRTNHGIDAKEGIFDPNNNIVRTYLEEALRKLNVRYYFVRHPNLSEKSFTPIEFDLPKLLQSPDPFVRRMALHLLYLLKIKPETKARICESFGNDPDQRIRLVAQEELSLISER